MAALLHHVGWRQVHQNPLRRQRQTHGGQRRAHPFTRFRNGFVRQAHHQESWQAGGDLHLHLDRLSLDAGEGEALDPRDAHLENTRIGCMLAGQRAGWQVLFYARFTAKAALAWQVGIISIRLMFICGGRPMIQAAASAISSGLSGVVPA